MAIRFDSIEFLYSVWCTAHSPPCIQQTSPSAATAAATKRQKINNNRPQSESVCFLIFALCGILHDVRAHKIGTLFTWKFTEIKHNNDTKKNNKNKLKTQNIAWREKKRCFDAIVRNISAIVWVSLCFSVDAMMKRKCLTSSNGKPITYLGANKTMWLDYAMILISIANLLTDNKNDEMIRFCLCRELIHAENHSTALYNFYVTQWYHIYYIFGMNFEWYKEIKK